MKVLFVSSGNDDRYEIAPFIRSQGESLEAAGVDVEYYTIKGKGLLNYIRNVWPLRKHIKSTNYSLIHAHYSLCGWVAVLTLTHLPIVLSLMGADAVGTPTGKNKLTFKSKLLSYLTLLIQPFVQLIISKSPNIEKVVYRKERSVIVPNGVQMQQFTAQSALTKSDLGLKDHVQYVLFLGSPFDKNKNIHLVRSAIEEVRQDIANIELINIYDVPHREVVKFLQVVDVVSLCSFSEGSPNVIKEAMACNKPIVATNVGDIAWLMNGLEGCFLSSHAVDVFASNLKKALLYASVHGATRGREQLYNLGLDAKSTAVRIIELYNTTINRQKALTI